MEEATWKRMVGHAERGLAVALEEGRGVDALAMMEALQRIEDKVRNWRLAEQQRGMMNAQRGPT